jgi:hypothetical protein
MKLSLPALAALLVSLPALASAQPSDAAAAPSGAAPAPSSPVAAPPSPAPAPPPPAVEVLPPSSSSSAPASSSSGPASSEPAPGPLAVPTPSYRYRAAPAPLEPDAERAAAPPPGPQRYDFLRIGLGFRVGYVDDPGLDTFADSDTLAQVSLDASYAFFTRGRLAIAAGLAYDAGSRTSGARGLTTKLMVNRITVPLEARYYLAPWVDVFAKVAPGTAALHARVEDPSSPATLEHTPWVFAADLSAGASFRVLGARDGDPRHPRLWITPELGYGVTSSHALRPRADRDEADVLGSDEPMRLGSLALDGVFWRLSVGLSF